MSPDPDDRPGTPTTSHSLAFEPLDRGRPRKRRWLRILLVLALLVAGAAGAGWYYFGVDMILDPEAGLPLIRADKGLIKVRPAKPGGMDIPNRDKLVYRRMEGTSEPATVERLLPLPEEPLPTFAAAPGSPDALLPETSPHALPEVPPAAEVLAAKPVPRSVPPPPRPGTAAKAADPPPPIRTAKAPAAPPKPPPAVPAPPPKPVVSTPERKLASRGRYQIQLAALRSEAEAEGEWARLEKRHADLLRGFKLFVVRVDLGSAKGVFYRLRVGPIGREATARTLCRELAKRKVGCLIVRE